MALSAFEEINSPHSLALALCLRYGDFDSFYNLDIDPCQYVDYEHFRRDFQAHELLRKCMVFGYTSEYRKRRALEKGLLAEGRCRSTNRRMVDLQYSRDPKGPGSLIRKIRRKIARLLGDFHPSELVDRCRWGPGADTLNKRPFTAPYFKYEKRLSVTRRASDYLGLALEASPLWRRWLSAEEDSGVFVPLTSMPRGDVCITVPKSAKTDRLITVGPGVNTYVQLGVGSMIRRRLKNRASIDLDDQSVNQKLALTGSRTGEWATIDLSSASDTIARELIRLIFDNEEYPTLRRWFKVMDDLRCHVTRWENEWRIAEKFSAMGNGFTFELETLVFWAIASIVAEDNGGICAAVYGDDIIVSSGVYPQVVEALEFYGFSVNTEKSFNSGYFRESCGMNAFAGVEVPTYRFVEFRDLMDVYSCHNGLRRIGLNKTANLVLRSIPQALRLYGPASAGDTVLHNPSETTWSARPVGRVDQWFFWGYDLKCLVKKSPTHEVKWLEPALLSWYDSRRPAGDHPLCGDRGWGSMGLVSLSGRGEVYIGNSLIQARPLYGDGGWNSPET